MKTITYYTADGRLEIIDNPEGTKAWSFQPIIKPIIQHLELVELNIKTKNGILIGEAWFIEGENIFEGAGALIIE